MYDPIQRAVLASELANAFLAGGWTAEAVAESGAGCLDRWPSWMTVLAMSVVAVHRSAPDNRRGELDRFIADFLATRQDPAEPEPPQVIRLIASPPALPVKVLTQARLPAARRPNIVELASVATLAERLELSHGQLAWLADVRGWERTVKTEQLANYRYRAHPRSGGMPRVIEAPKARLKEIQRWLVAEILGRVPAHEGAHGFERGRSALTHARLHTGSAVVLRLDLADFFPSVPAGRIYAIWRTLGYPPSVSHVLTGLTTNVVPAAVWQAIAASTPNSAVGPRFRLGRQLATAHLPQGAPTSPALANLAAFRLDVRLSGLAAASGLRYSRYADDRVPRMLKEESSRSEVRWRQCCVRDEGAGPVGLVALRGRPAGGGRKPPRGAPVKSRGAERRGKGVLSARQVWITKASGSEPPLKCRKRIGDIQNRGRVIAPGAAWREPVDWPGGCPAWMVARA